LSASDYTEAAVLDHLFGITEWTVPANLYVALFTAAPADSGGGTEVSGNAYARVQVTNSGSSWTRTNNSVTNAGSIPFAAPSPSSWGTVTHFGLYDASSAGNLLFWSALNPSVTTANGVALAFAAGALTVTAD
jgi:hypothetical protein